MVFAPHRLSESKPRQEDHVHVQCRGVDQTRHANQDFGTTTTAKTLVHKILQMKRLQNTSGTIDDDASSSLLPSPKRTKQDACSDADTTIIAGPDVSPSELASTNLDSSVSEKDEDYYFEDGSVTLRVEDVLFKIQASHLKNHSSVFKDMFAMPSGDSQSTLEGGSDDHPIIIPGVSPSEFRNLMKMFYCPPLDEFIESLQSCSSEDADRMLGKFQFYLDVARLSHRFDIPKMEKWASHKIQHLVSVAAKELALDTDEEPTSGFLCALEYYQNSQNFPMVHNFRNMIHCCWNDLVDTENPEDPSLEVLVAFFKTPNLPQTDPPTFGFLFALLLRYKVLAWEGPAFTKTDRMALFSAVTYLSSLPPVLQDGLKNPLFSQPSSGHELLGKHWGCTERKSCHDGCREVVFRKWQKHFTKKYYSNIGNEGNKGAALGALTSIPLHRLQLLNDISGFSCDRTCLKTVVESLDSDIGELFTKVASYYREIQ